MPRAARISNARIRSANNNADPRYAEEALALVGGGLLAGSEMAEPKPLLRLGEYGAGCRIRTRDLRFTKPLLYQLS